MIFGGIHLPFFVGALIAGVNALSVLFFLKESLKQKDGQILLKDGLLNFLRIHRYLKGEFGILFLILFAWAFALSNNNVSFPLLMDEKFNLNATHIGYFFTATAVISASIQGRFLPKFIKLMGERSVIFAGMIFQGGGLLVIALSWSIHILVLGTMIMSLGSALNRPTAEGIISRRAKTGQGEAIGIAQSFESLGRIFGPVLGGILYEANFLFPFLLSVFLLWFLALVSVIFLRIK